MALGYFIVKLKSSDSLNTEPLDATDAIASSKYGKRKSSYYEEFCDPLMYTYRQFETLRNGKAFKLLDFRENKIGGNKYKVLLSAQIKWRHAYRDRTLGNKLILSPFLNAKLRFWWCSIGTVFKNKL